ncbi:MAG: hypothetical protein BGO08_11145 [Altererythrobacter sp. 66-12]|nr:MAG: hypothetical protein BGO08_11145 [Altererythrobacter sp. 66-12]
MRFIVLILNQRKTAADTGGLALAARLVEPARRVNPQGAAQRPASRLDMCVRRAITLINRGK